ncbi:LOW QUALITY PROTEIN: zinc finger protein MAGPIE [Vigna radiata var. radiata]|uniref:LOW QUALITY PROTEIN: zinc finger protein MAGPIE n=1 Tax=Vigna radiata var. radiata TaxID=3916 RepID=A0A1S3TD77_VIGRR|nr:LOW QUALITY PROTEIN: zinc finger protein MAGPIE [Vigna radiata var. radiata]
MLQKMDDGEISNAFPLQNPSTAASNQPPLLKRKRNLPGNPDPEAEVIALSPKTLMATNRFVCEICLKGFQRDQNLQLHRRGHNLPWKLKQRSSKEVRKRVYVCPEKTCVHHHPSRALGDLTGIKKHFCRKHGEKKWKCEKCSKRYAVQSDWKAHSKTCGTREYKCDCGTIFSRRDSFITHRAFCDALAEETARVNAATNISNYSIMQNPLGSNMATHFSSFYKPNSCTEEPVVPGNQTSKGLSLWMSQTSQAHQTIANNNLHEFHQLGSATSPSSIYCGGGGGGGNPLAPCSNPPPSNYQLNWVFGNKISSNGSQELSSTASLPLVNNIVKDNPNLQLISVPSLYSSQHQSHQTTSANMSATALLQKAAQIGTTSSDPSLFLGSIGLKCNSPGQDGNKFCGMYGSSSVLTGHEGENNYSGDLSQMPPTKRRHVQNEESVWGQTRDFLGVGVPTICHPSSTNGWT